MNQDPNAEVQDDEVHSDETDTGADENPGVALSEAEIEAEVNRRAAELAKELTNKAVKKRLSRRERKSQSKSNDTPDPTEQLRREIDFRDAVDELGVKLNRKQRSVLVRDYLNEDPGDLDEWLTSQISDYGWASAPIDPTPEQNETVKTRTTQDAGAPAPSKASYTHQDNPLKWSAEQLAAIQRDKGDDAGKFILKAFNAYMSKVRVTK